MNNVQLNVLFYSLLEKTTSIKVKTLFCFLHFFGENGKGLFLRSYHIHGSVQRGSILFFHPKTTNPKKIRLFLIPKSGEGLV